MRNVSETNGSAENHGCDFTNSIGMKFVGILAGSFYMGSCNNDADDDFEIPRHKVHISKGFQMSMYEVTLGQFKQFIAGAKRGDLLNDLFMRYNSHGDSAAVTEVSWDDAQTFIHWLNKKEGGNYYRLPSEAEWEYVAKTGRNTNYSWGNNEHVAGDYAWYCQNTGDIGEKYAHAVGCKQPNAWGLFDMHGNVWEWIQDWYDENYYRNGPMTDPGGSNSRRSRVIRGGSWVGSTWFLRSSFRNGALPGNRSNALGFRLVRQA